MLEFFAHFLPNRAAHVLVCPAAEGCWFVVSLLTTMRGRSSFQARPRPFTRAQKHMCWYALQQKVVGLWCPCSPQCVAVLRSKHAHALSHEPRSTCAGMPCSRRLLVGFDDPLNCTFSSNVTQQQFRIVRLHLPGTRIEAEHRHLCARRVLAAALSSCSSLHQQRSSASSRRRACLTAS